MAVAVTACVLLLTPVPRDVGVAGQPAPAPGPAPGGGPNQNFYGLPAPAPVPAPGVIPAPSPSVQCCGVFLGPNAGGDGEYEVQVDLSGIAPGKTGATPTSGTYTINARVYVTRDWNGTSQLLDSRAWNSSLNVISSISNGGTFPTQYNRWETISTTWDMGTSVPYRVSIYFGYPMQNTAGYVYVSHMEFLDANGYNWIPNLGDVDCDQGFLEGAYQGAVDSYGNVGVLEGACEGGDVENTELTSCQHRCGGSAPNGCFCDDDCQTNGDCCEDFLDHCRVCDRDCPTGRYNKGCDNTIGYRNCQPCTTRPNSSFYYTSDGDVTDSCSYAACVDDCGVGQFLDGCGTVNETTGDGFGDSLGTCSNCTTKTSAQFYTSSGGLNDACAADDCDVGSCYSGQYLRDCGSVPVSVGVDHDNFPGVCTNCTNKPAPVVEVTAANTACSSEYVEVTAVSLDLCAYTCYEANSSCASFSYNSASQACRYSQCGQNTIGSCLASQQCRTGTAASHTLYKIIGAYYYTDIGGQADECPYSTCATNCGNGFFNEGCGSTTYAVNYQSNAGSCMACTELPIAAEGGLGGYIYEDDGEVRDYCDVAAVACPDGGETTPACTVCNSSGFNGTVSWAAGPRADNTDSYWDLSACISYCDGGNPFVSGGEAWCDFARAGADVCTVVPDADFDCTGLEVTCRTDGSRAYDVTGACVLNNCAWPGDWPPSLPDGYEVVDRYCGGDTWSSEGADLAVSYDQLELSCADYPVDGGNDGSDVGIRSAFGSRVVPWATVVEWRVNITKWERFGSGGNTTNVGELWFGVVEANPGGCSDDPSDWVDSEGDGCSSYEVHGWCASGNKTNGQPLAAFARNGVAATHACCACAGGMSHAEDGVLEGVDGAVVNSHTWFWNTFTGGASRRGYAVQADDGLAVSAGDPNPVDFGFGSFSSGGVVGVKMAGPVPVEGDQAGVAVSFTRDGVVLGTPFVDLRGGDEEQGGWWRVAASMRCSNDTVGNKITLDPTVATPMDIVNCAKSIQCATNFYGNVTLACDVPWTEFEVSGCEPTTCLWPELPDGYVLHDATCAGRKASDTHAVTVATCASPGFVSCGNGYHGEVELSCVEDGGNFTFAGCSPNECRFSVDATADTYTITDPTCGGVANDTATVTDCAGYVGCDTGSYVEDTVTDVEITCAAQNGTFEVTGGCIAPTCTFGDWSSWRSLYDVDDLSCGGVSKTAKNCNAMADIACRAGYSGRPMLTCAVPGADGIESTFVFSGCSDYDECAGEGTGHVCDSNAVCTNTDGSYTCTCNSNYTGDGRTTGSGCTDILACDSNACSTHATCAEDPDGQSPFYTCTCDDGLFGDGFSCTDAPVISFASGRAVPGDGENEAFLTFGDALDIGDYATCTDILDGDLATSLLLTDGADLETSATAQVDTAVHGSTDWTLACTDSDGNTTTAPFRVHVGFTAAVEALQGFARTHGHHRLRGVVEGAGGLDFQTCPGANSSLMAVSWRVGWHPRVLEETFEFCANSTAAPSAEFLAEFVVQLAEENGLNVSFASDFVDAEMTYMEYAPGDYNVRISAKVQIPAPAAETKFGVEQYTCVSTTCPAQQCSECTA